MYSTCLCFGGGLLGGGGTRGARLGGGGVVTGKVRTFC